MTRRTLVARVAGVQLIVTFAALVLVIVLTWFGVNATLTWKTDQALGKLLSRTVAYLNRTPEDETVDWQELSRAIDEIRPPDMRVEVRLRAQLRSQSLLALGSGPDLGFVEPGCADRDQIRVCSSSSERYTAIAARDRQADFATRNHLLIALSLACLLVAAGVALTSMAVTRRAISPLSDLATRISSVEPGRARTFQVKTALRELAVVEERFADFVLRFEDVLLRERHFASQAAHELRTPLTIARAELEAIASGAAPASGITSALEALTRLEALTEALLWFARAQAPLNRQQFEVVNLSDMLAQQMDELRRTHKAHSFRCRLPDEALVRGDEHLLASATANLFDNAVKYGDDAEIEVKLAKDMHSVLLWIANRGPSIPENLREKLFAPFARGEHGKPGFGLGLAFARAVARAHGGDLSLADHRHGGTVALMRLPLVDWSENLVN
jgi:signal transduction histidine kinase